MEKRLRREEFIRIRAETRRQDLCIEPRRVRSPSLLEIKGEKERGGRERER